MSAFTTLTLCGYTTAAGGSPVLWLLSVMPYFSMIRTNQFTRQSYIKTPSITFGASFLIRTCLHFGLVLPRLIVLCGPSPIMQWLMKWRFMSHSTATYSQQPESQVFVLKQSFEVIRVKCLWFSKMVGGWLIHHISESRRKDRKTRMCMCLCTN